MVQGCEKPIHNGNCAFYFDTGVPITSHFPPNPSQDPVLFWKGMARCQLEMDKTQWK